jgi:hypothetical protein
LAEKRPFAADFRRFAGFGLIWPGRTENPRPHARPGLLHRMNVTPDAEAVALAPVVMMHFKPQRFAVR